MLDDGSYRICVRSGDTLVYVKVSAELLAHTLPELVVGEISRIVGEFEEVGDVPMVSWDDQYIDFVTDTDFEAIPDMAWVTQASSTSRYTVENRLSGWSFGLGADISARLYDKTPEIKKSKKTFLYDLWRRAGWGGMGRQRCGGLNSNSGVLRWRRSGLTRMTSLP